MSTETTTPVMELRVIQNQVGKFNFANPSEETLSFSMGIYSGGKIVELEGVKAIIKFSGDPNEQSEFDDPFENLAYVFEKCYEDSNKWIGSTDYAAQCQAFAKVYSDNYEAIDAAVVSKHKESIQKQIDKLQKELQWNTIVPDITDTVNGCIDKEIAKYNRWISANEKEIDQLKEGTDKFGDLNKRNEGYRQKVITLQSKKIINHE